jgi:drug/metabolite transporter (DMT)-like permease
LLLAILATAIPTLALVAGLTRIEANRASVLGIAEPLTAVVLGAIVLSEPVTITTVLGGLLVVGSAYLSQSE